MIIKEWYIEIEGHSEGPYSVEDLKKDARITPDTLVWREGFNDWVPLRTVKELKAVFEDPFSPQSAYEENEVILKKEKLGDENVLTFQSPSPYIFFWILIIIALMMYLFFHT